MQDVFKRALRVAVTCGLLSLGYAGYGQGFAALAKWVGIRQEVPLVPYDPSPSRTEREALDLASQAFGPDHWAAQRDQRTCYYDAGRGFWFFFKDYSRTKEGRQIRFAPFALIWRTRGKANVNTIMADEAYIDFDRPFDLSPSGSEPPKVVHAMIEGEVRLRDDKGTTDQTGDDLTIGPLTHIEYSEAQHQLYTTSRVDLREKDLVATAEGLTIELRPVQPPPDRPDAKVSGYTGARTVWLHKKIEITVDDVGSTGLVPGSRPSKEPRPGNLTADGPAQIDMPEPRPRNEPPGPARPIIAQFYRNVRLRQGDPDRPDQCDADLLRLTLYPAEPAPKEPGAPETKAEARPAPEDGSGGEGRLSGLVLRLAEATGHAVWLQSPGQGLKARGNELRYERRAPEQPDLMYFRGDTYTWIEKETLADPAKGTASTVDTIRTMDVTILQATKPGDPPTVIARGPGQMETRPGKGKPVQQSATWGDRLELEMVQTRVGPRRRVTLTGAPKLISPTQGSITADQTIIAFLKPTAPAAPAAKDSGPLATGDPAVRPTALEGDAPAGSAAATPTGSPSIAGGGSFQIDWMEATRSVHMAAVPPEKGAGGRPSPARNINANEKLNVVFVDPAELKAPEATPVTPAEPPSTRILPAPASESDPGAPSLEPLAAAPAVVPAPEAPAAPQAPPGPPMEVEADEVWARVRLASVHGKPELEEVQLIRNVHLHQDPAPGKRRGTDATGDLVIFLNRGPDRGWIEAHGRLDAPARAITDAFAIEGPKLTLDQAADFAQVIGPGKLVQEAGDPEAIAVVPTAAVREDGTGRVDRADLPARGEAGAPAAAPAKLARGPVTITWQKDMKFYGRPTALGGQTGSAWAHFQGDVHAWSPDPAEASEATLACESMRALLDGPVSFKNSAAPADSDEPAAPKPRPQILLLHCLENVQLDHRQLDPTGQTLLQKGQVSGQDLWYNVRTGQFEGQGAGLVRFYQRQGTKLARSGGPAPGTPAPTAAPAPAGAPRQPARPAVNPVADRPDARPAARLATGTTAPRSSAQPKAVASTRGPGQPKAAARSAPPTPPLDLTRVSYRKGVTGRMAADNESNPDSTFQATFKGGVQVLHAAVSDEAKDLNADDPPADFMFLAAEELDVVREAPVPSGDPSQAAEEQFFIDARGGRPMGRDAQKAIFGDRITYDSIKQLVYVYGEKNGVTIANQDAVGQPASFSRGQAVMYNRREGSMKLIEPQNFLIVDPRSGIRVAPVPPGLSREPKVIKPKVPIRRVPANDKERKSFTGR